jgi:hypothetical protein
MEQSALRRAITRGVEAPVLLAVSKLIAIYYRINRRICFVH